MKKASLLPAVAGAALLAAAGAAIAATSTAWEMNTYQDFLKGRFSGVALSRDGRLVLSPKTRTLFSSDQPAIWSVVRAGDGTLYAGTGHRGRVFRIDPAGKSTVLWTADQPEVFAVALDPKGSLYAATSPDGKVYRLENGKAVEYFAAGVKYIWSMVFAPDGTLYVGTGDQGKVFRVDVTGKSELYYETGQAHVTSLALDREGRLLAGSEPNGILYRISAKNKAFVLYDANLPEIRSIVPMPDGTVYAAALGGSIAKRTGAVTAGLAAPGAGAPVVAAPTTITVTDTAASAQAGLDLKPKPEAVKPQAQGQQVTSQFAPLVDYSGVVEKSAVYKINPDNTVETLWSSKEENAYDVLRTQSGELIISTDGQGRIYRIGSDRKATLLLETNEGEATRLVESADALLAATGNMGKIYRMEAGYGDSGSYESPVHDAGTVARWGRLTWRANSVGGSMVFRTRSGNSARPDRTWSEWSDPIGQPAGVKSPNARYIQWKAEFTGADGKTPILENVSLAYLPQNTPPVIKSVNVTAQAPGQQAAAQAKPAAQSPAASAYSITVTDTGEAGASTATGTPAQPIARGGGQQIQVSWQAEDPDGDKLLYSVYFRGEDEREWKLLKANMPENSLSFDIDVLADGRYLFRVVASDRSANPAGVAREADMTSAPIMIDNTPPLVTPSAPRRSGNRVEIDIDAVDAASPLRRCEYSLDAGPWSPIEAEDGVTDSPRERFLLRLDNLSPREHLVVIRVYDAANNAGLAKVVVR